MLHDEEKRNSRRVYPNSSGDHGDADSKYSRRVKALEEKVGSLLALLDPEGGSRGQPQLNKSIRTPASTDNGDSNRSPSSTNPQSAPSAARSVIDRDTHFDVIDSGLVSMTTADRLLQKYKTVYSKYFPFVIVASDTNAAACRTETPFLFLSIVTACLEDDHRLQRRLGDEVRRILAERVVIGGERNLDLLQGLIVWLAWSHFHFNPVMKRLYIMLQMALGVLMDLELDRCPAHRDQRVGSHICSMRLNETLPGECRRSTAEIRALLGCFYICSSMAVMRKELAMTHTQWIDHCCRTLEMEEEYSTDVVAIALVRARGIVQKVSERFSYDDLSQIQHQNDNLLEMALSGFQAEVAQLANTRPFRSAEPNYALLAELKYLPVVMYEVALYRDRTDVTSLTSRDAFRLWSLLTSARDFCEYLLSIPTEIVLCLPSTTYHLLPYTLMALSMVSLLPSIGGWDNAIAKREVDFLDYCRKVRAKYGDDLTKTTPDTPVAEKDVWQFFSRGIGGIIAWHQRCESQVDGDTEYEIKISAPIAGQYSLPCAVADMMTSFQSVRVWRKPPPSFSESNGHPGDSPENTAQRSLDQPNVTLNNFWEDEGWQSILDEFSMFPNEGFHFS